MNQHMVRSSFPKVCGRDRLACRTESGSTDGLAALKLVVMLNGAIGKTPGLEATRSASSTPPGSDFPANPSVLSHPERFIEAREGAIGVGCGD